MTSWIKVSQIVISKSGHDRGRLHVVVDLQGEFAYIADGKYRSISSPKKKNIKHLQKTNDYIALENLGDRMLRKSLSEKSAKINKPVTCEREGLMCQKVT